MANADKFTARQEQFIVHYVAKRHVTNAALAAGCPADSASVQGSKWLAKPKIAEEVARRITAIDKRVLGKYEVTRERIVEELAKLGFSNMTDYTSITEDDDVVLDFSEVTRDQMAAVKEITSETYIEGRGDDARPVKKTNFKLYDKRAALMDLAKLEGHVVERQQLSGPNGGPIPIVSAHVITSAELTPETRAKLREALESMGDDSDADED